MMNEIIGFIQTVGFPIVVALLLLIRTDSTLRKLNDTMKAQSKATHRLGDIITQALISKK